MDPQNSNAHEFLQVRAYYRNKENVFLLQNPSHSNLLELKNKLFHLFLQQSDTIEALSLFKLKYLESSYLLPLDNQEQWQRALQYTQSQLPPFLHIFCSTLAPLETDQKSEVHPASIPLPKETDDEFDSHSLSTCSSSLLGPIIDSYIDNKEEKSEASIPLRHDFVPSSSIDKDGVNPTESLSKQTSEQEIQSQTDPSNFVTHEFESRSESVEPTLSVTVSADDTLTKADKAIQSTPLAAQHSKNVKKKASSYLSSSVPWNHSVNAQDLRNPEYETKLSLIDERANLSPTILSSLPPPKAHKVKKKGSPTPNTLLPFLDFAQEHKTDSSSSSTHFKPNSLENSTKSFPSRQPLHPIQTNSAEKNLMVPTHKEKKNQMETILEEDKQIEKKGHKKQEQRMEEDKGEEEVEVEGKPREESEAGEEQGEEGYFSPHLDTRGSSSQRSSAAIVHQPSPREDDTDITKMEKRELMVVPSISPAKYYKPILKDPARGDGSPKHIHFMDSLSFPSATFMAPTADHPKSILKKVSVSDPSSLPRSSMVAAKGSEPVAMTMGPDPDLSSSTQPPPPPPPPPPSSSSSYASPSYVLVPATLLPSLFPVVPPISGYSWPPAPSPSLEQQWGLPPRPKSMLEYATQSKYTAPRPYSATPPLSYYEQYLMSRK